MTVESAAFEQRVARIHRLLEEMDAKVTWDEHVTDPDNPRQSRQIDITIRRDGYLTLVECRLHRALQDVTWIEELVGRRMSLNAVAVIAVSASGFTRGARIKAQRFGVILRDFVSLSPEEVQAWGAAKRVQLRFIEFKDATLRFLLPSLPKAPYKVSTNINKDVRDFRLLLQNAIRQVEGDQRLDLPGHFLHAKMNIQGQFHVNGLQVLRAELDVKMRRITQDVRLSSVVAYSSPALPAKADAIVGTFELDACEIIGGAGRYSAVIDLSRVCAPTQCMLENVIVDLGRVVKVRGLKYVGYAAAMRTDINLRMEFSCDIDLPMS